MTQRGSGDALASAVSGGYSSPFLGTRKYEMTVWPKADDYDFLKRIRDDKLLDPNSVSEHSGLIDGLNRAGILGDRVC